MDKFHSLKGIAAPLPIVNIDTDMIIPKQFLKTIKRTGLGVSLFYEMRYDNDGNLIKDFVLNTSPFDQSKILVADLPEQIIKAGNHSINFEIEEFRKERLLQGLDDIGITLGYQDKINAYEEDKKNKKPWLFKDN